MLKNIIFKQLPRVAPQNTTPLLFEQKINSQHSSLPRISQQKREKKVIFFREIDKKVPRNKKNLFLISNVSWPTKKQSSAWLCKKWWAEQPTPKNKSNNPGLHYYQYCYYEITHNHYT